MRFRIKVKATQQWNPRPPRNKYEKRYCCLMLCSLGKASARRSDEGLTLEMSAFKLFTMANLRYRLS